MSPQVPDIEMNNTHKIFRKTICKTMKSYITEYKNCPVRTVHMHNGLQNNRTAHSAVGRREVLGSLTPLSSLPSQKCL